MMEKSYPKKSMICINENFLVHLLLLLPNSFLLLSVRIFPNELFISDLLFCAITLIYKLTKSFNIIDVEIKFGNYIKSLLLLTIFENFIHLRTQTIQSA